MYGLGSVSEIKEGMEGQGLAPTGEVLIEDEFYDIENFEGIRDFHQRVASYQAWYNLVRVNSNKNFKSPWQIIKEVRPRMNLELVRLPPLMLDWLGPDYITRDELDLRGYDILCYPWSTFQICLMVSILSHPGGMRISTKAIAYGQPVFKAFCTFCNPSLPRYAESTSNNLSELFSGEPKMASSFSAIAVSTVSS